MNPFIMYLIEASICMALFYAVYYFAYRKDTFHNLVRVYILFSVTASLTLPLIPGDFLPDAAESVKNVDYALFTENKPAVQTQIAGKSVEIKSTTEDSKQFKIIPGNNNLKKDFAINPNKIFIIFYLVGVVFFLFRLLYNLLNIRNLINKNRLVKQDNFNLVYLKNSRVSFSFLNYIFLQEQHFNVEDEKQIVAHELVHVKSMHTLDILFLEIVKSALWFNPFIWLFKSSMVKVHEYYADEQMVQGSSGENYTELLMSQYLGEYNPAMVHTFNSSLLQTRLKMMSKAKSASLSKYKLIFALPVIIFGMLAFSNPKEDDKNAKIEKLMGYYIDNNLFNGNISIYDNNQLIFEKSHGYADFNSETDLKINTPFLLGLGTESFTALSILKLKEQGKLTLNDPISRYFNDLPSCIDSVNIYQLLTHTSGIPPSDDLWPAESGPADNKFIYSLMQKIEYLYFKPGSEYRYSSCGYILLALIIEKVSGQTYQKYVQSNILDKAGMTNTYFIDKDNFLKNRVIGYRNNMKEVFDYPQFTLGNSGIATTINDLRKFEEALYSYKFISKNELNNALKRVKLSNGKELNIGLGFEIYGNTDSHVAGHYSWYGGTKTIMISDRDKNKSVFAMANNSMPRFWEMVGKISRILNDLPYQQPYNKTAVNTDLKNIKSFTGTYKLDKKEIELDVIMQNDNPYILNKVSSDTTRLYALNADTFFINEFELKITFEKDNFGKATAMIIHGDENSKYLKVD